RVRPRRGHELAIATHRPAELAARFEAAGVRVAIVGADPSDVVRAVRIGDPDAWQADWSALARARRSAAFVLHGCTPADHRALVRPAEGPPPLDEAAGDCWLVVHGRTRRARLDLP